jgi:hypothetical protein
MLDHQTPYSWDTLVESQIVINKLADNLDVDKRFLNVNTEFLHAVSIQNKHLAINAINAATKRLGELS